MKTLPKGGNEQTPLTSLTSGRRGSQGGFDKMGSYCYWWTATVNDWESANYRGLQSFGKGLIDGIEYKRVGFSVRLVKD